MKKIKASLFFVGIPTLLLGLFMTATGCQSNNEKDTLIADNIASAVMHTKNMLKYVGEPTGKNYPRTTDERGNLVTTNMYDWTPGFFPGNLWYLYELTGDTYWKEQAAKWTESLEPLKTFTGHHDLGFMMYCSYGNAERLASKPEYKDILIESAHSLATRFSENTKTIKSWNYRKAWNDTVEMFYPVIIDNMMNLEMLFYGAKVSGDKQLYNVAVTHANTTLKNHFREDFSTYHVVDYDTISGDVKYQATNQGYSDNSTWARGQAWAIYGYTMMYRETHDPAYLMAAIKATDYYLRHLPEDYVPYWDFFVGEEGYLPEEKSYAREYKEKKRDASAAAIVCSALFELSDFTQNASYREAAINILKSLSSPAYRAEPNTNANFILKHSVGSIPHKQEIDVPLVYADYYFLEALVRYRKSGK